MTAEQQTQRATRKNVVNKTFWYALRLVGLRRQSWNSQFKAGVWCRGSRSPIAVDRVSSLCAGGRLVEFGCGEGNLLPHLPRDAYSDYLGIDISDVAIERARELAREHTLVNCRFEQGDMASWEIPAPVSLILAEECIYYLKPADAASFLKKCSANLLPGGKILVIVHNAKKHVSYLELCREECDVVDEIYVGERAYLTMVPKGEQSEGTPSR